MAGLSTTALAILAGGNALNGFLGSRASATAAKQQGNYEASVLEGNALIADQQAADAVAIGKDQESRHLLEVRKLIGSERTASAASGVDISSGSAADIQSDSAFLGELDRVTIENNAKRQAWGFTVEANDLRNRAKLTRAGARNTAAGYTNQGYQTLIGGAAQIGDIYRKR